MGCLHIERLPLLSVTELHKDSTAQQTQPMKLSQGLSPATGDEKLSRSCTGHYTFKTRMGGNMRKIYQILFKFKYKNGAIDIKAIFCIMAAIVS